MIKPTKKVFTIMLLALVVILVAYGLARMKFGPFLPDRIDRGVPDGIIVAAIGIMLWNRQILAQEKKEAEARKKAEEEAAAAAAEKAAETEGEPFAGAPAGPPRSSDGSDGRS